MRNGTRVLLAVGVCLTVFGLVFEPVGRHARYGSGRSVFATCLHPAAKPGRGPTGLIGRRSPRP